MLRSDTLRPDGVIQTVALQDGNLHYGSTQDVAPILSQTRYLRDAGETGSKDWKHAAKIPNVVVEAYCNKHGITMAELLADKKHLRAIVNDSANQPFRIWQGKV